MSTIQKQGIKEHPKALRILAHIISVVFHPVFMPTFITLVLYRLASNSFAGVTQADFSMMILRVGMITLFFPLLTILLLRALGFLSSFQMKDPKDRIIPLMAIMILYFWMYLVFKNLEAPFIMRALLLGNFWGICVLFIVNIFIKVSMHTMAAGGVLGIMIVLMLISPVSMAIPLFTTLVIAGVIGTARMILKAHTPPEIWLGYILGILVQIAAYIYL